MLINKLVTESRNKNTMDLDECSTFEILKKMNDEDRIVPLSVSNELHAIEKVVDETIKCLKKGGRLIYIGAGTSGRIGLLDAVECPPTFGMDPNRVIGILAGGTNQELAKEEAEDSPELGIKDLAEINLTENDMVIGIAASGRTPYVIGALDYANEIGAATSSISCNKNSEISKHAKLFIEIDNGPEILTGSTRLKAGTSQKLVCNMISTASMIGLGKVYENLMVDVDVSNEKLFYRWKNIVMTVTGCDDLTVSSYYEKSKHNAKIAICMIILKLTFDEAQQLLENENGFVKRVLKNQHRQ